MGSGLSNNVNIVAGTGKPAVAMEVACRRDTTSELCMEWKNMKIFEGLSICKNIVFNVKSFQTLVWAWHYGKKAERSNASGMSDRSADLADLQRRMLVFAVKCVNANISQDVVSRGWRT